MSREPVYTVGLIMLIYIRAFLYVFPDPLPMFLGFNDGRRTEENHVCGIVGLTTQNDGVDHDDLQYHV